ncbi:sulfotransferase [candidate division KSB1 bacterium]|nr:sulfotransferase [candidate division KSB1 bacterium]
MLSRLLLMWLALSFSFDIKLAPLFTIIGFLLLRAINSIGLALDPVFFPQIRRMKMTRPIVIVGNPRSGTTFLHRFLVEHDLGAGMRLWKMLFPSLTLQVLLRPFVPLLERFSPAKHHASAAHVTSLTGIETDDPALFFRYFDGFFAYGFFLAWAEEDVRALFDPETRDTSGRDFAFLEKMWIRHLIGEKKGRMIPKLFSLTVRIPKESVMVVTYDRLMMDFDQLMLEIMAFIGVTPSDELLAIIRTTAERQRQFKSAHHYDLQRFGLSAAKIRDDYAPFLRG